MREQDGSAGRIKSRGHNSQLVSHIRVEVEGLRGRLGARSLDYHFDPAAKLGHTDSIRSADEVEVD